MRSYSLVLSVFAGFVLFLSSSQAAFAMLNCNFSFPNQVACFDSGIHGIVGDMQTHTGFDVVMQMPGTQNFLQIFQSDQDNQQIHSFWKMTDKDSCSRGWFFIQNANESGWGNYFPEHTNYCVFTINPSLDIFGNNDQEITNICNKL